MLRPLPIRPDQLPGRLSLICKWPAIRNGVAPRRSPAERYRSRYRFLSSSSSVPASSASTASSSPSSSISPAKDKYQHFDPTTALDSFGRIPSAPYDSAPLPCSAPSYPNGHLIIHPYSQARPQETWPAAIESVCPFFLEVNNRSKGQLQGWGVSFSDGDSRVTASKGASYPVWDASTSKVARPAKGDASEGEEFLIKAYQGNGVHATIGPYSLRTLPDDLAASVDRALRLAPIPSARYPKKTEEAHIYVCTHGSRDCRCGVVGAELKQNLREEVRKHEVRALGEGSKKVHVFGVSHVGGHKWAANALVYPAGDWYGNLRVSDAPLILRSALATSTSRHDLTDQRERLVHWPRWRGRLGLSEEQMRKVWEEWGGGTVETAVIQPIRRRQAISPSTTGVPDAEIAAATEQSAALRYSVPFRRYDGEVLLVEAELGENLKDIAQRGGFRQIEGTCGGKCECATCHAYLAPATTPSASATEGDRGVYASKSALNRPPTEAVLAAATDEESDMLDYAISRKATSRLLCQVNLTAELVAWFKQGGRVQLPRY